MFSEADRDGADWRLLLNGAITLFWRKEVFEEAKADLRALQYDLIEFRFEDLDKFYADVSRALNWRDQFGYEPWTGNLNALLEGIEGMPFGESGRAALCIEGFDRMEKVATTFATYLLDVCERGSRRQLLSGRRLIVLVQTDDPTVDYENIGAVRANWNAKEWLLRARA